MDKIKKVFALIYKSRFFDIILVFLFIAVSFAVGATAAYINHEDNPTDEAVGYFRAFVQSDFDKMYTYLDQEENCYISKSEYKKRMKMLRNNIVIDSYKVKDPKTVNGHKQVVITCADEVEDTKTDFVIKFNSIRKGLSIIPSYKVNIDNLMIKNYNVKIAKGDRLELNNEIVPEDNYEVEEDSVGNKTYTFDKIITGLYRVESSNKYGCQVKNENIIRADMYTDTTKLNPIANDEYSVKIKKIGNVLLNEFYKSVRKKQKKDKKIHKWFVDKKASKKKIDKYLKKNNKMVLWPGTKNLGKYKVSYFKINKTSEGIKYNGKNKTFKYTINYIYDYKSTIKTALYNSYVYKMSGKCKCQMILDFKLYGDNAYLTNISLKSKNKKDKFYSGR